MRTPDATTQKDAPTSELAPYSLWQLMRYFLRLGTIGFGGPVALVGYMQRDLVEGRKWIAGAFVFGSGLAIIPFLYGGVVQGHHWLTDRQFVDAVAVAMITPGPVVITSGFIGFLVAGFAGACLAALGTFLPCYGFVVIAAPAFRKYGKRPAIAAFVKGVTAAAIGAITGAVIILGRRTITDIPTLLLALVTLLLLWRWKKIPEPLNVLGAAVIGQVVYSALHHLAIGRRVSRW